MSEQMHLACKEGDIGGYVLLPGDPGRCETIAALLDHPQKIAQNREFVTYTGSLCGEQVSVCSTGIGGPSTAIAVEELHALGAHTLLRIGTCGGIQPCVQAGDLILASAAVRQDGTSAEYAPREFPAVADFTVLRTLADTARDKGYRHHIGVIQSKDSFYGQHAPSSMPTASALLEKWEAWKQLGVLASEMECAALFTVAAVRHLRAGAILETLWNQELAAPGEQKARQQHKDLSPLLSTAVESIRRLIAYDRASAC